MTGLGYTMGTLWVHPFDSMVRWFDLFELFDGLIHPFETGCLIDSFDTFAHSVRFVRTLQEHCLHCLLDSTIHNFLFETFDRSKFLRLWFQHSLVSNQILKLQILI